MMNFVDSKSEPVIFKLVASKNKKRSQRAVAPVIATILLVAISVVGGTLVFAVSEDYNSYLQINDSYQLITLKITGFDARDISVLNLHDNLKVNNSINPGNFDGQTNNGLREGERIAIYVQNNSITTVYFDEVLLGGKNYVFVSGDPLTAYDTAFMNPGEFVIATKGTTGVANLLTGGIAELNPGQEATFLLELQHDLKITRDAQIKITTTTGETFVSTILLGQNSE